MMKLKLFMPAIIGLTVFSGQSQTNIFSRAAQANGMRYAGVVNKNIMSRINKFKSGFED